MTRKDFELIAGAVRTVFEREQSLGCTQCANGARMVGRYLAERLTATNPRFNPERFLKACGVEDAQ